MENKLNLEYILILQQMRELNKKRSEIYQRFKKINPETEWVMMRTPSLYHDLFGNDLDKI